MNRQWSSVVAVCGVLMMTACASAPTSSQTETVENAPPTTQNESISGITCTVGERDSPAAGPSYAHPSESFYALDAETVPSAADLEHLVRSDNAVIVEYSSDLPTASISALQTWAVGIVATVVLPGEDEPAVLAYTQDSELECDGVDTGRLSEFAATRPDRAVEEHSDEG